MSTNSAQNNFRLVIAADIFSPDIGGPATYARALQQSLLTAGFEVAVVCYSDQPGEDATRIVRSRSAFIRYYHYFQAVRRQAQKADGIYAMGPVSSGLPALIASWFSAKPYLVKVVGDYAWEQAYQTGKTKVLLDDFQQVHVFGKIGFLRLIQRFVCRQAKIVIVPSQYLKSIVVGWGVAPKKVQVIYNSFAPMINQIDRDHARHELGFTADSFVVVSSGRPVPWKGFKAITKAVSTLTIPQLQIRFLGITDAELKQQLQSDADRGQTAVGRQSHEMVMRYLAAADLYILNSGYEGLSHALLEALAVGVPVAASRVGGNTELIQDGQNGLLFTYNNIADIQRVIQAIHDQPQLRARFTQANQEILKQFSHQNMIDQTLLTLRAICTAQ